MNTEALLKLADDHMLHVANRERVVMARGRGMYLYDTDGRKYLDFVAGWAVNALGHSPKCLRKALDRQAAELVNASPGFYNRAHIEFADYLCRVSGYGRVFFCSTGAEANEGAVKLARKYGSIARNGASRVICITNSFHGRTLAMMSATGKAAWQTLFEPKCGGFSHVPLNDFEALERAAGDDVCAVMMELVQGEGGVYAADEEYIRKVVSLCRERNILFIDDEIQTGLGRTGALFCCEHYGFRPDIMTLGKGIGGGFPLAAMLTHDSLNIFAPGEQGGTYTGQPLAMAAGHAVVKEIVESNLTQNAREIGEYTKEVLGVLAADWPITDIRGMGLLTGFDLPEEQGARVVKEAFVRNLLINCPPSSPRSVRLIPPLTVKRKHVDMMAERLDRAIRAVLR